MTCNKIGGTKTSFNPAHDDPIPCSSSFSPLASKLLTDSAEVRRGWTGEVDGQESNHILTLHIFHPFNTVCNVYKQ